MWKQLSMVLFLAGAAAGEVIHLSDGSTVQGKIYKSGSNWTLTTPDGKSRTIPGADVVSIDLGTSTNSGADLSGQLASLRRSLDLSADPAQAVTRLQSFIQHNPGAAAAKDAQKDLALWRDRLARHLRKIGNEWMTSDQIAQLRQHAVLVADHARQLMRRGDVEAAQKLMDQILAVDPQNVSGLYLDGVLASNANQLATAMKDFQAAADLDPHHGPTLNNLAVLLFHVGHFAEAAERYDQAMLADPLNRRIVDNVAEMLHAFPPEDLDLPAARLLHQQFVRQDEALQPIMAK